MFEKTGAVAKISLKTKKTSQKRLDAINDIKNLITEDSSLSIRKMASAIGVTTKIVFNILHDDLHLKPYKIHDWHKLEAHDYPKRVEFGMWSLSKGPVLKYNLICTDEAYFYLTESSNKQNNRNWADYQPLETIERPLHDDKILVWCGMSAQRIYGWPQNLVKNL